MAGYGRFKAERVKVQRAEKSVLRDVLHHGVDPLLGVSIQLGELVNCLAIVHNHTFLMTSISSHQYLGPP